jgi:hypothetical protein
MQQKYNGKNVFKTAIYNPGLCVTIFRTYRISRPIRRTLIFKLEILEKIMMNVF